MGFSFRRRMRGYRAAFDVEQYRKEAEALRDQSPDTFWQVGGQGDGSEEEHAAREDPVAYVAIFLAQMRKHMPLG